MAGILRSVALGILAATWLAGGARADDRSAEVKKLQDLEVVDCLLPGQVRQLGMSTYITARRPTKTTASDCRIRGGEYVAYDRANIKTALQVWMTAAQAGDPEAQTNVGEIFERGLGGEPNYEAAAIWYQKAADKGYSRALFDLGTLYEQGQGVPQDKLHALNLYRASWGLPADSVIYQSAARQEQEELRNQLKGELKDKDDQLMLLQQQLNELQKQMRQKSADSEKSRAQLDSLRRLIGRLQKERDDSNAKLATMRPLASSAATASATPAPAPGGGATSAVTQGPLVREPVAAVPAAAPNLLSADPRSFNGLNFGRYYALVIGNQHYEFLNSLATPITDAERVAKVLRDKYGFTVQVLEDTNGVSVLEALNNLMDVLKPEDNLLIYYGGHGVRLKSDRGETGYWLPVNSEAPPKDTFWLPNEQITAHLSRLPAKRILVVADSCYGGLLSADPSYLFTNGGTSYSMDYVAYKLPKRARLLLSSGGDEPVLDGGGGGNSVFARAFIEELNANHAVLPSEALFSAVNTRVKQLAAQNHFTQVPEFKSIKAAGHEVGDFFFVPRN